MKLVLVLFYIFIVIVLNGFAAATLWEWFIVPLGVATISIGQAIGIMLLIRLATNEYRDADIKKDANNLVVKACTLSLGPIFVLIVGWILKEFFM